MSGESEESDVSPIGLGERTKRTKRMSNVFERAHLPQRTLLPWCAFAALPPLHRVIFPAAYPCAIGLLIYHFALGICAV